MPRRLTEAEKESRRRPHELWTWSSTIQCGFDHYRDVCEDYRNIKPKLVGYAWYQLADDTKSGFFSSKRERMDPVADCHFLVGAERLLDRVRKTVPKERRNKKIFYDKMIKAVVESAVFRYKQSGKSFNDGIEVTKQLVDNFLQLTGIDPKAFGKEQGEGCPEIRRYKEMVRSSQSRTMVRNQFVGGLIVLSNLIYGKTRVQLICALANFPNIKTILSGETNEQVVRELKKAIF